MSMEVYQKNGILVKLKYLNKLMTTAGLLHYLILHVLCTGQSMICSLLLFFVHSQTRLIHIIFLYIPIFIITPNKSGSNATALSVSRDGKIMVISRTISDKKPMYRYAIRSQNIKRKALWQSNLKEKKSLTLTILPFCIHQKF